MSQERLAELAADFAAGELDPGEREELRGLLATAAPGDRTAAEIMDTAALLSLRIPERAPSPGLKAALLAKIAAQPAAPAPAPFRYVPQPVAGPWIPFGVPGAYIKVMQVDRERGYAVVLGKLDPGASYPAHQHQGPEELFMLTGDLTVGEHRLTAGDYHHSEAGTEHLSNHSVQGCTLIAVVAGKDLVAQLAALV